MKKELFGDLTDGGRSQQAEPPESQYPHVKRSLQQGEACLGFLLFSFGKKDMSDCGLLCQQI